jgi:hypothetical protein
LPNKRFQAKGPSVKRHRAFWFCAAAKFRLGDHLVSYESPTVSLPEVVVNADHLFDEHWQEGFSWQISESWLFNQWPASSLQENTGRNNRN